jgi:hypothetical protein
MTFARVNGGGWAASAELTDAQINQLDTDHVHTADKSIAGDTILGPWTFTAGTSGINLSGSTQGITISRAGGMTGTVAGAIQSTADGGIALSGGATDYVQYLTPHTKTITIQMSDCQPYTGYAANYGVLPGGFSCSVLAGNPGFSGGEMITTVCNTSGGLVTCYLLPLQPGAHMYNGATLTGAKLVLIPAAGHLALPFQPAFGLFRSKIDGSITNQAMLFAPGYFPLTVASVSNYNSGIAQTINVGPNNILSSSATIDTLNYVYSAVIWDESGPNAIAAGGTAFWSLQLAYGGINTSAPA